MILKCFKKLKIPRETVLTYEEVGGHMAEVGGQCPPVPARGAGPGSVQYDVVQVLMKSPFL